MFLTRVVGSTVVASLLLMSGRAQAAIIYVPGDRATIQSAIDTARDGDQVVIADGIYSGPGNHDLDFGGKAITVRSAAGDPSRCVIDCAQSGRGFLFDDGETPLAVVNGLTIVNGMPAEIGGGGGISCLSSSPTIANCVFLQNNAAAGGAIDMWEGASPLILDCRFEGNESLGGGAIWAADGCLPVIVRCTFRGNRSLDGGAILNSDDSHLVAISCTFDGNEATNSSGAIGNGFAEATIVNCTFIRNRAPTGSALLATFESRLEVTNSTFVGNTHEADGGLVFQRFGLQATFENCIAWGNGPAPLFVALDGPPPVISFSDIEGGWGGPGRANIDADPRFVDAGSDDYRLDSGSPCIDAGRNDALPADVLDIDDDGDTGEILPLDGGGQPRRVDDPDTPDSGSGESPIVDMGAYERQAESCPWDLSGDGVVDFEDLVRLIHALGRCEAPEDCPSDFNGDGFVGLIDLIILIFHWGPCP